MTIIHRFRAWKSPLRLRVSIHRLRAIPDPLSTLRHLLWPFPWSFTVPPPFSVDEIQDEPNILNGRHKGLDQLYAIPIWRARDTPICALYRIYENLCAGRLILMSYDYNYFYRRSEPLWRLSQMPDPKDRDPVRYAVLACLVEVMADAIRFRKEKGIARKRPYGFDGNPNVLMGQDWDESPEWAKHVPIVAGECLNLVTGDEASSKFESMLGHDPIFARRNIKAKLFYLYNI